MADLVDEAIAAFKTLPQVTQDEIARFMLELATTASNPLSAEESLALTEAEGELGRGERVTAEALSSFWNSRGL